MLRYKDPADNDKAYLSDNKPVDNLIRIICDAPKSYPNQYFYPSCKVKPVCIDQFDLDLTFAQEHLTWWWKIAKKMRVLSDSFITAANMS